MSDKTQNPESPQVVQKSSESSEKLSMHEGVANWCDCCICEAEPYWLEVAEEMGINMSDYEDGR